MKKIGNNYSKILKEAGNNNRFLAQISEIEENKEKGFNIKTLINKLKFDIERLINLDKTNVGKYKRI